MTADRTMTEAEPAGTNIPLFLTDADVATLRRMVDGWYGNGADGETWDNSMAIIRAILALAEKTKR